MKKIYWFRLTLSLLLAALTASTAYLLGGGKVISSGLIHDRLFYALAVVALLSLAFSHYVVSCTVVSSKKEIGLRRACVLFFALTLVSTAVFPLSNARMEHSLAGFIIALALFVATSLLIYLTYRLNRMSCYFLLPYAALTIYLVYVTYLALG